MTPFSAPLHASGRAADLPPLGHWLDLVGMALCLAVLALAAYGCEPTKHYDSDKGAFVSSSSTSDAATTKNTPDDKTGNPAGQANVAASDSTPSGPVAWCYGGFNGSRATHDPRCRISSLRVSPSGMSYKWESGGCQALGASSAADIGPVCALFFQAADGSWKGGKFDHISTSRTSRDWLNLKSGYNGWNWGEVSAARSFCFVILSADGRRRSNYIFATGSIK